MKQKQKQKQKMTRESLAMPSRTHWKRFGLFSIFLIPLAYFSYLNRHYQLDDALIYQRYVANLLAGHGLVYNQGEFFNALTSPLYTCLCIIGTFVIGNTQQAVIGLAAIFMALSLVTFTILFSRYEGIGFVPLGALIMACSPYFYYTYGMETPLFVFLIGLGIYLFEIENYFLLGIACALLILTRGEGVFLILAMGIEHLRQRRPFPRISHFVVPVLILGANYLFNMLYYGALLPHSVSAKIHHGASGMWGDITKIGFHFGPYFDSDPFLLISVLALVLVGVLSLRLKSLNVIAVCFLVLYGAFYYILKIPNYHWYYAPFYAFGFFYAGTGSAWLLRQLGTFKRSLFRVTGTVAVCAVMIFVVYRGFSVTKTRVSQGTSRAYRPYRHIGLWLKKNTPPDSKIAAMEVGTLGYYSDRYIIDIVGVVSPLNARFYGERRFGEWLNHYSPDYIVVRYPGVPHEIPMVKPLTSGMFVEDKRASFPGFKVFVRNPAKPL